MRYSHLIILALFLLACQPAAAAEQEAVDHICRISAFAEGPACPTPLISAETYYGARSDPGLANGPIDIWGYCRYVDNVSESTAKPVSLFIPFKSAIEWKSFRENAPTDNMSLVHCARSENKYLYPDPTTCKTPEPTRQLVNLPYERYYENNTSETKVREAFFRCKRPTTGQEFVQRITASFKPLDSDLKETNPAQWIEYWHLTQKVYDEALWKE